jgi:hypothetical protein
MIVQQPVAQIPRVAKPQRVPAHTSGFVPIFRSFPEQPSAHCLALRRADCRSIPSGNLIAIVTSPGIDLFVLEFHPQIGTLLERVPGKVAPNTSKMPTEPLSEHEVVRPRIPERHSNGG